MKEIFLNRQCVSSARMFALLIVLAIISAGCGRIKEDFEKGMEEGRRQAKHDANANANPADPKVEPTPIIFSKDNISDERAANLSAQVWKYKPGDDANWAAAETSDADWETLKPEYVNNFSPPKSGWSGIGWFRLRLDIDESLANQPLGLTVSHPGASEIYVDGKLTQTFGTVAANPSEEKTYNPRSMPIGVNFAGGGTHVIAVRYSNTQAGRYTIEPPAFKIQLVLLNSSIASTLENTNLIKSVRGGTFGICLALGLLHLLLFVLYPRQLGNLFYSLFLLAEASSNVIIETFFSHVGAGGAYVNITIGILTGAIYFVSFTAYLYTVLENRLPRYLRVMAALWLISLLIIGASSLAVGALPSILLFFGGFLVFMGLMIWHIVSVSIVIVRAVARKVDNSWVLGVVGVAFIISSLSSTVLGIAFGESSGYLYISQFVCLIALIIANAVFLARQFARTSTELEIQLVKEVQHEKERSRLLIVEAENKRRAEELEEARQLQLSMLPKKLPQIPNLEIAAYMKPATEVGGDYYDFHVSSDGTLTIAVGDATGHGLKAGTMVSVTKGLFNNLAAAPDIPDTLIQISRALKSMNLRGLFMALTMLKIKDNKLIVCAAGMPSTLIYRAETGNIEEIELRAMPLGSVSNFTYQEREIALSAGDCVVVLSDGFPEMFNEAGEMLADDTAKIVLAESAQLAPQEIVNRFVAVGEAWAGNRPQDDDVTFVVLKVK
jgi:serine phosphatase RsbU (regulator of sigma subunit)